MINLEPFIKTIELSNRKLKMNLELFLGKNSPRNVHAMLDGKFDGKRFDFAFHIIVWKYLANLENFFLFA